MIQRKANKDEHEISFIPLLIRADQSVEGQERAVPLTLVTETPIDVYDKSRGEIVKEIVCVRGVEWPKQVPLVDSHEYGSVGAVLGSIRDFNRNEDGDLKVDGVARFASKKSAIEAYECVRDGHITDASVGARRLAIRWLGPGEKAVVHGRSYEGPVRLVTRARIKEGSIVVIGADGDAKFSPALRAYRDPHGCMEDAVNDELRELLIARGMDASLDDAAAVQWAKDNLVRAEKDPGVKDTDKGKPAPKAATSEADLQLVRKDAEDIELKRSAEINAIAKAAKMPLDKAMDAIIKRTSVGDFTINAIEWLARQDKDIDASSAGDVKRVEHVESERDKVHNATRDGLLLRAFGAHQLGKDFKAADGSEAFRHKRLVDIGREYIRRAGGNADSLPDGKVAEYMLGTATDLRREDPAYNVSGGWNAVTLDVANNSLRKSYTEATTTYQIWAKRGPDFTDFKDQRRSILGEISNPVQVPENRTFPECTYSDNYEGYHVEVYAMVFSITLQAILNNSLNAFSDAPAKMGNAFARMVNAVVYGVLTANAALSDSIALFHSSHSNTGSAGAISKTTMDEMFKKMMKQTGINSSVITGFTPRWLLMPPDISGDALQFFGSRSIAINTAGNSETVNIYGPGGPRTLTPLVEPYLTNTSTTGWYGIADPNEVDTVEYSFLSGYDTPQVAQNRPFNRLAVEYSVVQAVGSKALDYRGLFSNSG